MVAELGYNGEDLKHWRCASWLVLPKRRPWSLARGDVIVNVEDFAALPSEDLDCGVSFKAQRLVKQRTKVGSCIPLVARGRVVDLS